MNRRFAVGSFYMNGARCPLWEAYAGGDPYDDSGTKGASALCARETRVDRNAVMSAVFRYDEGIPAQDLSEEEARARWLALLPCDADQARVVRAVAQRLGWSVPA